MIAKKPLPVTVLLLLLVAGAFSVASADNPPASPARPVNVETLRMMETIEKKTLDLKKREEQVRAKEQQLKVLEKKVKTDLEKIQQVMKKTEEMLGLSKDISKKKIDMLVKIYSSMPPKSVAPLMGSLDEKLAVEIITRMKSKIAGQVLGQLDPQVAKKITEKLIGKKLLEATNPAPASP